MTSPSFESVMTEVRACRQCAGCLPHEPRPVIRGLPSARLLIVGQAPGFKVHQSGLPFNDRSGDRLRDWLDMDRKTFYNEQNIAFMPTGLCYPGREATGADRPPLKICAPLWHPQLLPWFPRIKLTLLIGGYAQKYYLKKDLKKSLTETVFHYQQYLPLFLPLPHPSWRNTAWLRHHSWFEERVIPILRQRVRSILDL